MRWTKTLVPTLKEVPSDAQIISHQLMLRAGLIRQVHAGVYDFLPLGLRALRKAEAIVRQEMDAIGCNELLMPALHPAELWQQTGRDVSYGENLMKLKDRHGRLLVLGPTHEEIVTELVRAYVNSYRQLPLSVYQIQTKFRDEYRPRFGLLRVREFIMKDAYSFHADLASLDAAYRDFYGAYERIFRRCGLPFVVVEAESGPIGGSASHEFMAACSAGEDLILSSDKGNYAANVEKCGVGARATGAAFSACIASAVAAGQAQAASNAAAKPTGELEELHTPGCPGIDDVVAFFSKQLKSKLKTANMLKTLVCEPVEEGQRAAEPFIIAVVRGDHDVNLAKLQQRCGFAVQLADLARAREAGFAVGFVGPHAAVSCKMYVDPDATIDQFWVTGANRIDHHVRHFNWQRDVMDKTAAERVIVADIRNAMDADPSPLNDGGVLKASRGIELGHVFKLGTKYSTALDAKVLDDKGAQNPMIMGCYGIGIGRILIAAIENSHDDKGIIWPTAIAPFQCCITPIRYEGEAKEVADRIYGELSAAGIDCILDDRDARPGVKFNDADLVGFPLRITLGDKSLKEGKVEMKKRSAASADLVALDNVLVAARAALA